MSQIGVFVTATEIPSATAINFNTATAFVIGLGDWGPVNTPIQVNSMSQAAAAIGTPTGSGNGYNARTTTNATLFDALDTFFGEGGTTAYIGRAAHGTPVAASLALKDVSNNTCLTLTAQYAGPGGNGIYIVVNNTGSAYTITLQDALGNQLAVSPTLTTLAGGVTWAASTGLVTGVVGTGTLPITLAATAMTGGTDNRGSVALADYQAALNSFSATLGPGQVFAPGLTNTTMNGIWSALGTHAQSRNRVALCDMDDAQSVSSLTAALGTFGTSGVASYCGFWAGNLNIPGIAPSTTRSVSPSAAIAGLCSRVDATGNPNIAAAGARYPLQFATASTSLVSGTLATYSASDIYTLNSAGINSFAQKFGRFENYGFVSSVPSTTDAIYWQFNHARMRMALVSGAQVVGEPYVFSQIDGQGSDETSFATALTGMLSNYYQRGALYGASAAEAFNVNVGPTVNTPQTIAQGQLNANCNVRLSPFAQMVNITLNAVPITQAL